MFTHTAENVYDVRTWLWSCCYYQCFTDSNASKLEAVIEFETIVENLPSLAFSGTYLEFSFHLLSLQFMERHQL